MVNEAKKFSENAQNKTQEEEDAAESCVVAASMDIAKVTLFYGICHWSVCQDREQCSLLDLNIPSTT